MIGFVLIAPASHIDKMSDDLADDLPQLFAPPPKRALPTPPVGYIAPPPPPPVHEPLAGGRGAYVAYMAGAEWTMLGYGSQRRAREYAAHENLAWPPKRWPRGDARRLWGGG